MNDWRLYGRMAHQPWWPLETNSEHWKSEFSEIDYSKKSILNFSFSDYYSKMSRTDYFDQVKIKKWFFE